MNYDWEEARQRNRSWLIVPDDHIFLDSRHYTQSERRERCMAFEEQSGIHPYGFNGWIVGHELIDSGDALENFGEAVATSIIIELRKEEQWPLPEGLIKTLMS